MSRALAVRLDSAGDVLLTGPAIRALACDLDQVDLLVSPEGAEAAVLLPGVEAVLRFSSPWAGERPAPALRRELDALVDDLQGRRYDEAVVFTSYHQSALPMALLARMAGIPRVVATSDDYPGSLVDVRHHRMGDGCDDDGGAEGGHEVVAALRLVEAAGHRLAPEDDDRLRIRRPLPPAPPGLPERPYAVLHPGASVPVRGIPAPQAAAIAEGLHAAGWGVVVTGGPAEADTADKVAGREAINLAGSTSLGQLAAVIEGAEVVIVGNTGPAHLAAAVGTPVVSIFAPVVPAARWAPWRVPTVLLGDQAAPCAGSRARVCPVPGHPCVGSVGVVAVLDAVHALTGRAVGAPVHGWAS